VSDWSRHYKHCGWGWNNDTWVCKAIWYHRKQEIRETGSAGGRVPTQTKTSIWRALSRATRLIHQSGQWGTCGLQGQLGCLCGLWVTRSFYDMATHWRCAAFYEYL